MKPQTETGAISNPKKTRGLRLAPVSSILALLLCLTLSPGLALAADLVVPAGQTVTLPGGTLDYGTVTVDGTLNLTGETSLLCAALDIRGTVWYSGSTTIMTGKGITDPQSSEFAMRMSNGAGLLPEYFKSAPPPTGGRDGYSLTLLVRGHFFITKNAAAIHAVDAQISAGGQHGEAGVDGLEGEPGTCENLDGGDGGNGTAGSKGGRGGNIALTVTGNFAALAEAGLRLDASGGNGGNGGSGGSGAMGMSNYDCRPPGGRPPPPGKGPGKGGNGAGGALGGDGGSIFIAANKIEKLHAGGWASVTANGGPGGRGGSGGSGAGPTTLGYGTFLTEGGTSAAGTAGGKGGLVRILAACNLDGLSLPNYKLFDVEANGGDGGLAGRPGANLLGGPGLDNLLALGGDAGEVQVLSPVIVNARFSARGGRGGFGGKAQWRTNIAQMNANQCASCTEIYCCCYDPATVNSGAGAAGGSGGRVRLLTSGPTDVTVTSDVAGGSGGVGGGTSNAGTCTASNCLEVQNPCYKVIAGADGQPGAMGVYGEAPLTMDNDTVVTVVSANKNVAAPGECIDYFVATLAATPKHDVAARLEVPTVLRKITATPNVPMEMQNRAVQWNVADLLPCAATFFHLRARLDPAAKSGSVTTRAESFVSGLSTGRSEDVVVRIDENRLALDTCSSSTPKGDLNDDTMVDLTDAEILLHLLSGREGTGLSGETSPLNGSQAGPADLLFILQQVPGLRP